ncbi:TetR family transcriptional regulator [Nonomuraea sp. NPDC050227]|uniref:TetR family transcriptional regulator n=1 Tax=Nonomuraea sp. NPDC050227 TaxID=3364360 RepID=UPI0037B0C904
MKERDKLIDGAERCLQERGYAHTTARDIARTSGANLASSDAAGGRRPLPDLADGADPATSHRPGTRPHRRITDGGAACRACTCRRMTAIPSLTLRQALLVVDAVNGMHSTDRLADTRLLAQEVEAVIALGAAAVWAEEGRALLDMIKAWTTRERLAVIAAAERFWACSEGGYEEGLRAVGLLS